MAAIKIAKILEHLEGAGSKEVTQALRDMRYNVSKNGKKLLNVDESITGEVMAQRIKDHLGNTTSAGENVIESPFKKFKGKNATLNSSNQHLDDGLAEQIASHRDQIDIDKAAEMARIEQQKQIKENIKNWRNKEQELYNSRAGSVSNNYSQAERNIAYNQPKDMSEMNEFLDAESTYKDKYTERHNKKKVKREQAAQKKIDTGNAEAASAMGDAHGGGKTMKEINEEKNPTKKKNALMEKGGNFMRQAIPIAVGGGLVFSMFNRGGQMSNSELYGQQQSYSGGY